MLKTIDSARMRRMGFLALLFTLAATLVTLVNPLPARADVVRNVTNIGIGLQLSSNFGDGTTGDVFTVAASSSIYHDWYIVDGNNEFINSGTSKCLSSNFGNGSSGDVYTVPCSGSVYQNWRRVTGTVSGGTQIINVGTGWCLSSNFAGDVYTVECSGAIYHNWKFA
ncbi:hypothetical protein KIH74_05030 [Kineosporia sp. J2-2]|uniref:Ricin B lectin domain-containing protein n=1 Tax=Kineosporia corallincola TaxID=2835133 RepID=A0ABS5TB40_9ACTN|nr:hypothetical protein [Kineosporia corallincola]MBT0768274.1 hypothetical protein [Kineosporia corallincola]